MKTELDRAWEYHSAADDLLHGRSEALLIAQAFLVVAYFQVLGADKFAEKGYFTAALAVLVILAIAITAILMYVNRGLSRGLRFLKSEYLEKDDVYRGYLKSVRGSYDQWKSYPALWSFWLPMMFLGFWMLAGLHVVLILTNGWPK